MLHSMKALRFSRFFFDLKKKEIKNSSCFVCSCGCSFMNNIILSYLMIAKFTKEIAHVIIFL